MPLFFQLLFIGHLLPGAAAADRKMLALVEQCEDGDGIKHL